MQSQLIIAPALKPPDSLGSVGHFPLTIPCLQVVTILYLNIRHKLNVSNTSSSISSIFKYLYQHKIEPPDLLCLSEACNLVTNYRNGPLTYQAVPPPATARDNDYSNSSATILLHKKNSNFKISTSMVWTNKIKRIHLYSNDKRLDITALHLTPLSIAHRKAYFKDLMNNIEKQRQVETQGDQVIIGDFNLQPPDIPNTQYTTLIHEPTLKLKGQYTNSNDHILTNLNNITYQLLDFDFTDHKAILCSVPIESTYIPKRHGLSYKFMRMRANKIDVKRPTIKKQLQPHARYKDWRYIFTSLRQLTAGQNKLKAQMLQGLYDITKFQHFSFIRKKNSYNQPMPQNKIQGIIEDMVEKKLWTKRNKLKALNIRNASKRIPATLDRLRTLASQYFGKKRYGGTFSNWKTPTPRKESRPQRMLKEIRYPYQPITQPIRQIAIQNIIKIHNVTRQTATTWFYKPANNARQSDHKRFVQFEG